MHYFMALAGQQSFDIPAAIELGFAFGRTTFGMCAGRCLAKGCTIYSLKLRGFPGTMGDLTIPILWRVEPLCGREPVR
jgi:hypothetical protein